MGCLKRAGVEGKGQSAKRSVVRSEEVGKSLVDQYKSKKGFDTGNEISESKLEEGNIDQREAK